VTPSASRGQDRGLGGKRKEEGLKNVWGLSIVNDLSLSAGGNARAESFEWWPKGKREDSKKPGYERKGRNSFVLDSHRL